MNKFQQNRLGVELLLATVCALTVAFLLFTGLREVGYSELDKIIDTDSFIVRQETACATRLQNYVTQMNISATDRNALNKWATQEKDVILNLYRNNMEIYSSIDKYELVISEDTNKPADYSNDIGTHKIIFADGTAQAFLSCFFQYRYYSIADAGAGIIAFISFVIILLSFIRRKTRYITNLEKELKILEGGDLSYPITIRGKDELSSLATGIDAMRRAVSDRQECWEQAQNANRELITAMSHDLRTPLTSLMGYLDILALQKYNSEDQMRQFILASKEKAYRIKDMSDKLFEYFLVYGKDTEAPEFEQVNGAELVGQLVEESLFDLENEGFEVKRTAGEISCTLAIEVDMIRRVFGNIFSNITKYADRSKPVLVSYYQKNELHICFENNIDQNHNISQGTNIGLKTCESILQRHSGTFHYKKTKDIFLVEVTLPILKSTL